MTTDTSAGLPGYIATCGVCGTAFGKDEPFFNVFCPECPKGGMRGVLNSDPTEPSEADALLADLRGKHALAMNEAQQAINFWMAAKDEFEKQLEAERAKVRELQERADTAVRSWWVYMAAETDTERDEAYEMMSDAIAALPASVDAKGENHE
jgi:hypothetical protein